MSHIYTSALHDLLQLSVNVLEKIKVSDRIVVANQSDKKVDANVSVNESSPS